MLNVGKREAVNPSVKQSFDAKPPTTLEEYLGVQVFKCKTGEKALGQPTITKGLEKILMKMARHYEVL